MNSIFFTLTRFKKSLISIISSSIYLKLINNILLIDILFKLKTYNHICDSILFIVYYFI